MTSDYAETVLAEISRAHRFAEAGKFMTAVQSFALARDMVVDLADARVVKRAVAKDYAGFARERENFRSILAARAASGTPVVIFADSLALPRPLEKTGANLGCEATYPWLLGEALGGRPVDSFSQRYFTTDDVVAQLTENPKLGADADVLLHVGLNDCSFRMFMTSERLALKLLPDDVATQIVKFAQLYRRQIIRLLPLRQYVQPDVFRANLDHIVLTLRARKARRIVLTTITLPPVRAWLGTPGVNMNYARYNEHLRLAARQNDALLFDLDREIWSNAPLEQMSDDGMHLSVRGHAMVATRVAHLLTKPVRRQVAASAQVVQQRPLAALSLEIIRDEILRAFQMIDAGKPAHAAQIFADLRGMIVERADPVALREKIAEQRVPLRAAREAFRVAVAGQGNAAQPLLILTDAAALPMAPAAVDTSFAWRLGQAPFHRRVTCLGQQGYVAADVLAMLANAPKQGYGTDALVMIGGSDSAHPLLDPAELAAAALLPPDLGALLQEFAAAHGGLIAPHLPARPAVAADQFGAQMNALLRLLRARGAKQIYVATIPSVGDRAAHNFALMDAARTAGATVIDFDRLVREMPGEVSPQGQWSERLHTVFMQAAGMYLPEGKPVPEIQIKEVVS